MRKRFRPRGSQMCAFLWHFARSAVLGLRMRALKTLIPPVKPVPRLYFVI